MLRTPEANEQREHGAELVVERFLDNRHETCGEHLDPAKFSLLKLPRET